MKKTNLLSFSLIIIMLFTASFAKAVGPNTFTNHTGNLASTVANWSMGNIPSSSVIGVVINGNCILDVSCLSSTLVIGKTIASSLTFNSGCKFQCTSLGSAVAGSSIDMTNGGQLDITSSWNTTDVYSGYWNC